MQWVTKAVVIPIATFAVVILVTIFGILPVIEKVNKHGESSKSSIVAATPKPSKSAKPKSGSSGSVCRTDECVAAAAEILKAIDETVSPCENFYEFACGNWMKTHQSLQGEWSQATGLTVKVNHNILQMMTQPPEKHEPLPVRQAKLFLKTCVQDDLVHGDLELKNISEVYTGEIGPETPRLDTVIAKINRDLGGNCIFQITVNQDIASLSSTDHVIYIDNPFNVPGKVLVSEDEYLSYKAAYTKLIQDTWLIVYPQDRPEEAKKIGKEIVSFEKQLEEISYIPEDVPPRNKEYYHLLTLPELNRLTANTHIINWERYFSELFKELSPSPVNLDDFKVVVRDLDYVKKIGNLLRKTMKNSTHIIKNYIKWRIVLSSGYFASPKFQDLFHEFVKLHEKTSPFYHILLSIADTSRETKCWLQTNTQFDMAIAYLYVQYSVTTENFISKLEGVVRDVQKMFYSSIKGSKWISSEETKQKILAKANITNVLLGFPEGFDKANFDDGDMTLQQYYKHLNVTITERHFQNCLQLRKWKIKENLALLTEEKNPKRWFTSPTEINAFFIQDANTIIIPAAKLQPPFYYPHVPIQALNYGSIGCTVGHEFTHELDQIEKLADEDGNLNNVWDSETLEKYDNLKNCFVRQYNSYTVDELQEIYGDVFKVNGSRTLDENFADNGGINIAFKAYREYLGRKRKEGSLPGIDFTSEQLFFIAYAQSHCGSYSLPIDNKESLHFQLKTSKYSPYRIRVMGALANSPHFSSVWNCRQSKPQNICSIW